MSVKSVKRNETGGKWNMENKTTKNPKRALEQLKNEWNMEQVQNMKKKALLSSIQINLICKSSFVSMF